MNHFMRSLKVFWRSERLIRENEVRLAINKTMLNGIAGLVAIFGLVMLNVSVFFALDTYMANSLAALTVGGIDVLLAGVLVAYANSLKPAPETEMVKDMRDMAIGDMENDLKKAEAELAALRSEARKFVRNPIEALLPVALGPLVGAVAKGVLSNSKKEKNPVSG